MIPRWRLERMSESAFQSMVIREARSLGWLAMHTDVPSGSSDPGYPDLHLVRGGVSIFWELKALGGRPTEAQRAWISRLLEAGHRAEIRCPLDWPSMLEELRPGA